MTGVGVGRQPKGSVEDEEEEEVEDVAHMRDCTGCRLLIKAATEIPERERVDKVGQPSQSPW